MNIYIYICDFIYWGQIIENDLLDFQCVFFFTGFMIYTKHSICIFSELPVNIVKPLQDKTVLEKTRVILDCTVSNPRCSIRWYKGNNVILPSERFEICSEGCYRKLIIQQVALDDEGMYSVQVGEYTCSAKLTVEGKRVQQNISCLLLGYLGITVMPPFSQQHTKQILNIKQIKQK